MLSKQLYISENTYFNGSENLNHLSIKGDMNLAGSYISDGDISSLKWQHLFYLF